ncbi:DUF2993 family protein [Halopolyspora algeriensis]|uniref:DUF2993 family protein n=1 Tax=Halopolyspora algeriensis TaxID=1500506 RepID=A0A368VXW1_9ACTN|nr:LmeA family phospholipid-binding protein [Halopolyspora algeriensis]RCW47038.1 DUF2993 family protein [Halopolyspora algeriensis]TQM48125.1 DUF2993 family protein [Halopolyspora algeriensis]
MKRTFPVKKLAITLVIMLGLLVAADFGAAAVAEYQVSQKMRTQLDLAKAPAVRINGFPFLTQAIAGDFRNVQIRAKGVQVGEFTEVGVQANLHHARVSTSEILAGTAEKLTVDKLVGRIRLKDSDIGRFIGVENLNINPASRKALTDTGRQSSKNPDRGASSGETGSSPGDPAGQRNTIIKLDGTVNIAGTDNHVQVIAVLSLVDGKLRIAPRKLELDNSAFGPIPLPDVFEESVLKRFTTTLDPGKLPFTVTPTAVRAERGALVVEGTTKNVTINAQGLSTP